MPVKKRKDINLKDNSPKIICSHCNPKIYLKFNFSFIEVDNEEFYDEEITELFSRIRFFSSEPYRSLIFQYQGDKKTFIEEVNWDQLKWKNKRKPPEKFREHFPYEPNEKVAIFRVKSQYHKKIRVMGMIKNTVFYVFYLDWNGELYDHGS